MSPPESIPNRPVLVLVLVVALAAASMLLVFGPAGAPVEGGAVPGTGNVAVEQGLGTADDVSSPPPEPATAEPTVDETTSPSRVDLSARDGWTTLRGRVVLMQSAVSGFHDPRPVQAASIQLSVRTPDGVADYAVVVEDGRYRVQVERTGAIRFSSARVDGAARGVIGPEAWTPWPSGDAVALVLADAEPAVLVVESKVSGEPLQGVDVLAIEGNFPMGHPGPRGHAGVYLIEREASPVPLGVPTGLAAGLLNQTHFARAPGHAWKRFMLSHAQESTVELALTHAGTLAVALDHPQGPLPEGLMLRVESFSRATWSGSINSADWLEFESFSAGQVRVVLVQLGVELDSASGHLTRDGRLELTLSTEGAVHGRAGDLEVQLDVPGTWPVDRVRLRVNGTGENNASRTSPPLLLPPDGSRRVRHVFRGVERGQVVLAVHPMRFSTLLDHTQTGQHRLQLPPMVEFSLDVRPLGGGEPLRQATVSWSNEDHGRRWFCGPSSPTDPGHVGKVSAAQLGNLPAGRTRLTVFAGGYQPATIEVDAAGGVRSEVVVLEPE